MVKRTNKPICRFRLERKLHKKLNPAIACPGCKSKSDFISALVLSAISGPDAAEKETGIEIPWGSKEVDFPKHPQYRN